MTHSAISVGPFACELSSSSIVKTPNSPVAFSLLPPNMSTVEHRLEQMRVEIRNVENRLKKKFTLALIKIPKVCLVLCDTDILTFCGINFFNSNSTEMVTS
jgi:hypothetical protein